MSDLASALRVARRRRDLTQTQLGKLLSPPIDHSLISLYEHGLKPPPATLQQLVKLLKLTVTVSLPEDVEQVAS